MDFEMDTKKHYVRVCGWLAATRHRKNRAASRKRPIKYLTFCAAKAMDVFLLEMNDLLFRNPETDRLDGVYICEYDEEAFSEIVRTLAPTESFFGDFASVVLFEESDETAGRDFSDIQPQYNEKDRARLLAKDAHERLSRAFPFDIINLDLDGSIFPAHETLESRLLNTLRRLLQWQQEPPSGVDPLSEFTLFLTTRLERDDFSANALRALAQLIDSNRTSNSDFDHAFEQRFGAGVGTSELLDGRFVEFCALGVPKKLLEEAAQLGWKVQWRHVFSYVRDDGKTYHMLSLVCHLSRSGESFMALLNHTIGEAVGLLDGPEDVDVALTDPKKLTEIEQNRDAVRTFRDERLRG